MRLRLLPSHSFRHSRFTLANRITSLLPTIRPELTGRFPEARFWPINTRSQFR